MSRYKEQPVTLHHVTEYGFDTDYYENKWFELRIGETVIGRGETLEEAIQCCDSADSIDMDIVPEEVADDG